MKRYCLIAIFFIAGVCTPAVAQEKLDGELLDKITNKPVSFANLSVKGKPSITAISNEEGYFKLDSKNILDADTLFISHVNYISVDVSVHTLRGKKTNKIALTENTMKLREVQVHAAEDYVEFENVIAQTKKSLHFPITSTVYYRELVKENKSFNKFADGLLTVIYEQNKDENEIKIRIDQCRTDNLPKDEDDQFELVSPVKLEFVLGQGFGNFLNRFRNDNQKNYHYYAFPTTSETENI